MTVTQSSITLRQKTSELNSSMWVKEESFGHFIFALKAYVLVKYNLKIPNIQNICILELNHNLDANVSFKLHTNLLIGLTDQLSSSFPVFKKCIYCISSKVFPLLLVNINVLLVLSVAAHHQHGLSQFFFLLIEKFSSLLLIGGSGPGLK